jgi:hypothetical protein
LSYPELVPPECLGIDPWKMASKSRRTQGQTVSFEEIRASIQRQLEPAIAANAVRRIEREIDVAVHAEVDA